MARYIDADRLIADSWMLERHGKSNKLLQVMSIADVPTADVVEVVRCKDCKHYDIRNARCLLHSELADQYSSGFNFEMYSNDYCSYGEQKL